MTVTPVEPQVSRAELHLLLQAAVRDAERSCGQDPVRCAAAQGLRLLVAVAVGVLVYDVVLLLRGLSAA